MTKLQTKTLVALRNHVPTFDSLPRGEKVLQAMAYLADVVHVREELGRNHGRYVDDFLREAGGLGPGAPWCAACLNWCCEMVGAPNPTQYDASVMAWKNWASAGGRLSSTPARGRLCLYTNRNGTGHIGIVVSSGGGLVRSIEGNTSSGSAGSQRDGDGLYRRARRASTWKHFINLD